MMRTRGARYDGGIVVLALAWAALHTLLSLSSSSSSHGGRWTMTCSADDLCRRIEDRQPGWALCSPCPPSNDLVLGRTRGLDCRGKLEQQQPEPQEDKDKDDDDDHHHPPPVSSSSSSSSLLGTDVTVPKSIRKLDLSENHIRALTRTTFGPMPQVLVLNLGRNCIADIDEYTFASDRLQGLRVLQLGGNQLGQVRDFALFGLDRLEYLDLSQNKLRVLAPQSFQSLTRLTRLSLRDNPLLGQEPLQALGYLSGLPRLKSLYLEGTGLRDESLSEEVVRGMRAPIAALGLARNALTRVPREPLALLSATLRILDLSDNPGIKWLNASSFPSSSSSSSSLNKEEEEMMMMMRMGLPQLRDLRIDRCPRLTHIGPHTFAGMPRLESLSVSVNRRLRHVHVHAFRRRADDDATTTTSSSNSNDVIGQEGGGGGGGSSSTHHHHQQQQQQQQHLVRLSLRQNALSRLDARLLPDWGAVSVVDLQGNPWHCDCHLRWLKKLRLPKNLSAGLRCRSPSHRRNRRIDHLRLAAFTCPSKVSQVLGHQARSSLGVEVFLILVFLSLVLFFLVRSCRRRRAPIRDGRSPSIIMPGVTAAAAAAGIINNSHENVNINDENHHHHDRNNGDAAYLSRFLDGVWARLRAALAAAAAAARNHRSGPELGYARMVPSRRRPSSLMLVGADGRE
ncbi:unnamed protein product [Notodromas monacha]|uniref:LRRCT domain-containing protein n=1 Tax=Notodromas monacha TaxID=399045 RepID=A0A7R9BLI5_9CRUS|nr:unnamed protein product [Notodromas monacha]CAG0916377.1 unnamed protein product [Notodromas monacha]